MTLTIRDDARREIQKDVDAMTLHPRYFNIKVERAKTYFPIIEKVFAEERLPDDFKYLVLQESALISDAVSVSNAVGFWQFKDFTAMEMGLRVDKEIDERMNIYSATRGAAKYLKKNNYLFNNWLLALQSYQMGGGGVQRSVGDKYNGARHMEITSETYWYIKKFLAHKIAYENAVKGEPQIKVVQYQIQSPKTLSEIASELSIDEATLKEYNKWVRVGKIPADRPYSVIIPSGQLSQEFNTLMIASTKAAQALPLETKPVLKKVEKKINGILAIQAWPGETTTALAVRGGVPISDFLRYNEIPIDHVVQSNTFYFVKKKKRKSNQVNHTYQRGENLWAISQQYGVQLNRLKKLNKISDTEHMKPGELVWLSTKKPATQLTLDPVEVEVDEVVAVAEDSFFGWEVKPREDIKTNKPTTEPLATPISTTLSKEITTSMYKDSLHTVLKGETLYSIAKTFQVNVTDLLSWNRLDIGAGIKQGQVLKVKTPVAQQPVIAKTSNSQSESGETFIFHEVKPADTLYSVARHYNVTIKEIMDWNKKQDFNLTPGEKLKVLSR